MRPLRWFLAFSRLNGAMKVQVLQALLLPWPIWIGFRTVGVPRTQALLRSWSGAPRSAPRPAAELIQDARRSQRLVRGSTRIGGTCLVRSFTLWAMLRKRGLESDIRIGMRRNNGRIEGHAWVEYQGQPINEDSAVVASYSAMPEPATFDLWLLRSLN